VNNSKRSPLKDRPLRNPGQSLDEQLHDVRDDYVLEPLVFALLIVLLTAAEWWKYYQSQPPAPFHYSIVAVVAVAYAVFRFYRVLPRVRQLKLGRDGEKEVGQNLEALRERGYQVFHDVVGDGFNLDHVLIGPAGVFTVETKTHSKPAKGDARIAFDGERILVDGFELDRNPVVQAKAQASWLRELLAGSTGRSFEVRSVIVYPGWFVEHTGPSKRGSWVLNPKALPAFLDHEPAQLTPEDAHLASFHLSRFVRTANK